MDNRMEFDMFDVIRITRGATTVTGRVLSMAWDTSRKILNVDLGRVVGSQTRFADTLTDMVVTVRVDDDTTIEVIEKMLAMPKGKAGDVYLLDGHHPVLCWRTREGWDVIGNTISENDVPDPILWARGHSWHVDKVVKYGAVS